MVLTISDPRTDVMAEAICSTDIRSSGRGYSWPALSDPNAIYARYVAAVSRRDLNAVLMLASASVRNLKTLARSAADTAFSANPIESALASGITAAIS